MSTFADGTHRHILVVDRAYSPAAILPVWPR